MTAPAPTTWLDGIELLGYRGFAAPASVSFARPDPSKVGSGLTILVGANGSGKSTVLEVLRFLQKTDVRPPLDDNRRNTSEAGRVALTYTSTGGRSMTLGTRPDGGGDFAWTGADQWDIAPNRVFTVPARRRIGATFGSVTALTRNQYIAATVLEDFRSGVQAAFPQRLVAAEANKSEFDAVLARVIHPVPRWHLGQEQRGRYLRSYSGGSPFGGEGLADGIAGLFHVIDALYDSPNLDVIGIDEPELSLYPAAQHRLLQVLANYAISRQIIYATHSPLFVEWDWILNGASIVRFARDPGSIRTHAITAETRSLLARMRENRNNPHILGPSANEVFFLDDQILLLEGQEDVVLFPKVLDQLGATLQGTIFGWGVGGADNMSVIAALLNDLGFRRVAGMVDKNKSDSLPALAAQFPRYLFVASPADDIRTKADKGIDGLLGKDGKIQPNHQKPFQDLLSHVNHYLTTGELTVR